MRRIRRWSIATIATLLAGTVVACGSVAPTPSSVTAIGAPTLAASLGPSSSGLLPSATAPPTPSPTPRPSSTRTPAPTPRPTARPTPAPTPLPGRAATVDSVVDGDTIHALVGGVHEKVRVIGIDSPETSKPNSPVECMARAATAEARRLLPVGAAIRLEQDPTQATRDRYDRLLAHVWLPDGRLFAEVMIRGGFGIHYVYDRPSVYAARLAAAQEAAKAAKIGLWSPATCNGDAHEPAASP
jgi:micrococcal nuclease